ncbi:hypothetical protein C2G38_2199339 [Gigaspora rosea]|uniref:Uncharacterized protein n=1 Tax=Gigaspora rosea TaxID=44941 RepID=A0A397UW09_9GLOM|nr:hypothetical protein C2G38_2199339 [Gigaspora rosea]
MYNKVALIKISPELRTSSDFKYNIVIGITCIGIVFEIAVNKVTMIKKLVPELRTSRDFKHNKLPALQKLTGFDKKF